MLSLGALLALAFLPGGVASFGLPCRGLSRLDRALLGATLTPFVVAAELMLLKSVGVPFGAASRVVLLSCVAGLVLWFWRLRSEPMQSSDRPALGAMGCVVALFGAVLWWSWTDRGVAHFWEGHVIHHAELVYAVARPGVVPENPMLAGFPLRYPFLAHYYWAWLGWCLDLNPLVLWERTALVWFSVMAFVYYRAARVLGLRSWFGVLGVLLLLAGGSPFALVSGVLHDSFGPFGSVRYAAYLQKFVGFNVMMFALPALAGILLLSLHVVRGVADRSWFVLLALVTIAAGMIYPLLFPFGLALAGLPLLLPGVPSPVRRDLLFVLGVGGLTFGASMSFFVGGRGSLPLDAWNFELAAGKLGEMALGLGPFLLIAAPELFSGLRRLDPRTLLLAAVVCLGAGFYVVVPLPSGNEYKAVFVAMLGAGLLAARSLDLRFGLRPRTAVAVIVVLAPLLAVFDSARLDRLFGGAPLARQRGENLQRPTSSPWKLGSFWLEPLPGTPEANWTLAMRAQTPPDSVVVSPPTTIPVSPLTQRSEWVGRWRAGEGRLGYGYNPRVWTVDVRGAPYAAFRGRSLVQTFIYSRRDQPERFESAAASLHVPGRAMAIYFPSADLPFLHFLDRRQIGRQIWAHGESSIWQIDPVR